MSKRIGDCSRRRRFADESRRKFYAQHRQRRQARRVWEGPRPALKQSLRAVDMLKTTNAIGTAGPAKSAAMNCADAIGLPIDAAARNCIQTMPPACIDAIKKISKEFNLTPDELREAVAGFVHEADCRDAQTVTDCEVIEEVKRFSEFCKTPAGIATYRGVGQCRCGAPVPIFILARWNEQQPSVLQMSVMGERCPECSGDLLPETVTFAGIYSPGWPAIAATMTSGTDLYQALADCKKRLKSARLPHNDS